MSMITSHINSLFMHISIITMALMGKNQSVYTHNCLDSSCQFTLIAKILIADCPIARILIAKSTIAKILIAKSNNCPNTDCWNTACRDTDCLNTGESCSIIFVVWHKKLNHSYFCSLLWIQHPVFILFWKRICQCHQFYLFFVIAIAFKVCFNFVGTCFVILISVYKKRC